MLSNKYSNSKMTLAWYCDIMCRKLEREDLIHSLAGSYSIAIANLQYTDDILIFGRGNVREAIYIKCYSAAFKSSQI